MIQRNKINRKAKESLIIGLIIILMPIITKAQLFEENELYPNVERIKGKYFNGTGGGGYWSLDYPDSIGRIIKKENYHKNQLISQQIIEYDDHNNILFDIQTFDFNNPGRIDTFSYEYKYSGDRIIYEYRKLSDIDSTVIKLVKSVGDSIFQYQERYYYYRPKTGITDVYETIFTLRYKDSFLISNEIFDKEKNSTEIKNYEYYSNGKLKRRVIEHIPKQEYKAVYLGGPGSDDEYYEYKFDVKGRIKKFYKIINGKKYKIAVYHYEEK